jgi:hypothetical protein
LNVNFFFLGYTQGCEVGNIQLVEPTLTDPVNTPTALPTETGSGSDDGNSPVSGNGNEIINTGLALGPLIGIAAGVPVASLLIFGGVGLLFANHVRNRRRRMLEGYFNLHPNGY